MKNIQTLKDYLAKRILHTEERVKVLKEKYGDSPSKTYNFYGGHALGYWEGKLSTYQSILDEVEVMELETTQL